jgi:hypothetical protein
MTTARSTQAATLLPAGDMLVTGGVSGAGLFAELYNPSTGTWSSANRSCSATRLAVPAHGADADMEPLGGLTAVEQDGLWHRNLRRSGLHDQR